MTMAIICLHGRNDRQAAPLSLNDPTARFALKQFVQPRHAKRHAERRYSLKGTDIQFRADDGERKG
jgi:hypothetical protein